MQFRLVAFCSIWWREQLSTGASEQSLGSQMARPFQQRGQSGVLESSSGLQILAPPHPQACSHLSTCPKNEQDNCRRHLTGIRSTLAWSQPLWLTEKG